MNSTNRLFVFPYGNANDPGICESGCPMERDSSHSHCQEHCLEAEEITLVQAEHPLSVPLGVSRFH